MKRTELPIPELGLIAATRVMLGAGIGLLAAGGMDRQRRKAIGLPLLLIGAGSTIPLIVDIARRARQSAEAAPAVEADRFLWEHSPVMPTGSPVAGRV